MVYYVARKITLKPPLSAIALALYGVFVSMLVFVQQDPSFVRIGGLIVGLAVYPFVRGKIDLKNIPFMTRMFLALVALVVAFGFATVAKNQVLAVQFFLYLVTGLTAVNLPLVIRIKEKGN